MPTLGDRYELRRLALRRWLLGRHPALLWAGRRYPEPEIALLALFARKDAITVDVGASYGMWTFHARRYSRAVVAFEPQPAFAHALRRGFARSRTPVEVHQTALSAAAGRVTMTLPPLQPGYSTIEPANHLNGKVSTAYGWQELEVETRTLDSFALDDVAFVKVDAEGHEESVLVGARDTLRRCRPALAVETEERHKPGSVEGVSTLLADLGYHRLFVHDGVLHAGEEFSLAVHQDPERPDRYVRNLIFLHDRDLARLRAAPSLPFARSGV
ncbi:MAG: FkbM family methyltransferase [Acidobacteriota bacterium]